MGGGRQCRLCPATGPHPPQGRFFLTRAVRIRLKTEFSYAVQGKMFLRGRSYGLILKAGAVSKTAPVFCHLTQQSNGSILSVRFTDCVNRVEAATPPSAPDRPASAARQKIHSPAVS